MICQHRDQETGARQIAHWLVISLVLLAQCGLRSVVHPASVAAADATWTLTGNLAQPLSGGLSSTLLPDGTVIVISGAGSANSVVQQYDPGTNRWTQRHNAPVNFGTHSAVLLRSGLVLVVQGALQQNQRGVVFTYNPADDTWQQRASMSARYQDPLATVLTDGRVLLVDVSPAHLYNTEIYDATSDVWTAAQSRPAENSLITFGGDEKYLAFVRDNGDVLFVNQRFVLRYSPTTNTWNTSKNPDPTRTAPGGKTSPVAGSRSAQLKDGRILIVGGCVVGICWQTNTVDIYDPQSDTWSRAASMNVARGLHSVTTLSDGRVLVAGKDTTQDDTNITSAEIYDPTSNIWTLTTPLHASHSDPVTTLLQTGQVLILGEADTVTSHIPEVFIPVPTSAPPTAGKEARALIFIGGLTSYSHCDGTGLMQEAPKWIGGQDLKKQPWSVTDVAYFSYTGKYCGGENSDVPDYEKQDTCGLVSLDYASRLRDLIKRVTDKPDHPKVTLVAHSQGGYLAAYVVGLLQEIDPTFVRQRIASVVLFDSFPTGLPDLAAQKAELPFFLTCGPWGSPYFDWNRSYQKDSPLNVAHRASTAAQVSYGYQVKFYTLAADGILSLGGHPKLLGNVTSIPGEIWHEQIHGTDHVSIWDRIQPRTLEIVRCALIRATTCNTTTVRVSPGGTALTDTPVAAGSAQTKFVAGWHGSTVSLALISPDGVHIDPTNMPPGVVYDVGPTYAAYTVTNPTVGTWQLSLYGADIPDGGEDVSILTDTTTTGEDGKIFQETGKRVGERFYAYWAAHGGLSINGYPISDEFTEVLDDGQEYSVQYFERVRMEYHPENAAPYNVLLGQFGRKLHPADPPVGATPGYTFFEQTGHNVNSRFMAYWNANGGLAQFGLPLSEEFTETLEDGKPYQVQYFERARFEYHPGNAAPYDVLLGQFGRRIFEGNSAPSAVTVQVDARQEWQSSTLTVTKGTTVKIEVIGGQWTHWKGEAPYNPGTGGAYICGRAMPVSQCSDPESNYPQGALVGQVGSAVFGIGQQATIVAPQSGTIYLRINDLYLVDNDGTLTVRLTIIAL